MFPRTAALLAATCLAAATLQAYTFTGSHWTQSPVMQLQLGPNATPLSDGSPSWDASAQDAWALWNSYIGAIQVQTVPGSSAPIAQGNGYNNVFFSNTVYGSAWGTGVLAVTLTYTSGSTQTAECDVLFNQGLSWDSYRGPQRSTSSGAVYDFHRVALHEFGHVLGLDHPDQAGQSVVAIMNSTISDLDTLAADDIAGAQALYGPNPATAASAPAITTQPASQTVLAGGSASFSVAATSTAALSYQWWKDGAPLAGATSASLVLSAVTPANAGNYDVVVSNSAGSTTSATATLTVTPPPAPAAIAPTITRQPASHTVNAGGTVTFSVTASGTPAPAFQWYKGATAVAGMTGSSYTIGSVGAGDAGTYSAQVTNSAGTAVSAGAVLTVNTPPVIASAPSAQTVNAGSRVVLSVGATGSPAPGFQWQKNGSNLAGATSATLVINAAAPTDAGTYDVVVTNAAGAVSTVPVLLTVDYSQIVNISTRGFVPAGGALTSGFVLAGSGGKPLVIRGVGPTLDTFGVTDPLPAAQIAVFSQQDQTLATNDGWSQTPQLSTAFQSVGAFPLPAGSTDAASEMQLTPGAYTTRVTAGTAGGSGIALAEVYDAAPTNPLCHLVNVSTRGFAGSGDQALVAGFTIAGNAPKRVLIRAVGPGLAPYGVTDAISDPQLAVYPVGQSNPVARNDNWGGAAALQSAFTSAGAFALDPASTDAAIVLSLAPGGYTVVVTGVNGATGTALVEVYDLGP